MSPMSRATIVALLTAFMCALGRADTPSWPVPLVFTNDSGSNVVFAMNPPLYGPDDKITREAFGIAYRLGTDGKFTEIYRTDGWYSFRVFVSQDGHYLIQMGPWNEGDHPEKTHLAVAFHKDGKLLKSYSTADLIKDPSKIEATTSHYRWLAPARHRPARLMIDVDPRDLKLHLSYDNVFTLHTIDDLTYEFDATTGTIKSTKPTGS